MATGGESVRCRCYLVRQPRKIATLTFDASLTGGGASLAIDGRTTMYMDCDWHDEDWRALGVTETHPRYQPLWEAYMLLVALEAWKHELSEDIGKLKVIGDAEGVLQAAVRGRAKLPKLNEVIAEQQLQLAHTKFDLTAIHIWSERNAVCDQLSRLSEGASIPDVCLRWRRTPRLHRGRWRILGQE